MTLEEKVLYRKGIKTIANYKMKIEHSKPEKEYVQLRLFALNVERRWVGSAQEVN